MHGRAPEGYYVTVDVTVRLANGKLYDGRWVTRLALHRAHAKGPTWIRQDMRKKQIKCRSKIVVLDVRSTLQKFRDGETFETL